MKNSILDVWQGSEYTSDILTTRQIRYKVFKGKIRTLRKKTEKKWIWWKKSPNISKNFIFYIWQRTEETVRNIVMNEAQAQVFSSEFTYRASPNDCF